MIITKKHLSRRTVLKGMGVTLALPFLDAMTPAGTAWARTEAGAKKIRLVAMEMVHGSAGSTAIGVKKNLFAPAKVGRDFEFSPTLEALAPFRNDVTIISNTDVHNAEAFTLPEIGGDHFRSSAVFLTQSHPKQTEGNDVFAGTSLDQLYAQKFGQDTPIPSMQLSIESVAQGPAAHGPRPARRLRSIVRRRRDAAGARGQSEGGPQHPRLDQRPGHAVEAAARRDRPPAA